MRPETAQNIIEQAKAKYPTFCTIIDLLTNQSVYCTCINFTFGKPDGSNDYVLYDEFTKAVVWSEGLKKWANILPTGQQVQLISLEERAMMLHNSLFDNPEPDKNWYSDMSLIFHKKIMEYIKFLDQDLNIDMFEGDCRIFEGGKYVDIQPSTECNYYTINGMTIFRDRIEHMKDLTGYRKNGGLGLKIKDLVHLDLMFKQLV